MSLTIDGKYVVQDRELGRGAWSVVRPCEPIPPYEPPMLTVNPLFTSSRAQAMAAIPPVGRKMDLVAKVISKAHVEQLAGGNAERARADVTREVDTLRVLPPHPNVVRFIEHLEDENNYYIIFEAAPKGDLCDLILKAPDSRISETQAKQFTTEILRAVLHCHRYGTAHRDIKPENLLVGHGDVLKLTDFGLAKVIRPSATNGESVAQGNSSRKQYDFVGAAPDPVAALMYPSRLWADGESTTWPAASKLANAASTVRTGPFCPGHEIVGTLRYGAPEMFQAKFERSSFDAFMADAWSVGVVVYIMLSGNFPFSAGANATERETYKVLLETPVVPPAFLSVAGRDFLLRLLEKNPEKRMPLSEALDHKWLREVVERNDHNAREALRLRGTDPTAIMDQSFACPTAPPPIVAPTSLLQLRAAIDHSLDSLSPQTRDQLTSAFDGVLSLFDNMSAATARLREQLFVEKVSATGGKSTGGASARSASGTSARRGPSPVSTPGRASAGGQPPAVGLRPPSPAARKLSPAGSGQRPATPTVARVPSPGRPAAPATAPSPTAAPRSITPTHRVAALAPPTSSAAATRRPATRADSPSSKASGRLTPTGSGTLRTSSASRTPVPSSAAPPSSVKPPATRQASPLSRASPVARRGTPLRTPAAGNTTPKAVASGVAPRRPAPTPPTNQGAPTSPTMPAVGDTAVYKDHRAIVRFVGETGFATGQWVGLEMLEGREGIHDGTSAVDKRRYFTCPNGRGIFVRPSQVQPNP
jgi:serine/threonine protein kinase